MNALANNTHTLPVRESGPSSPNMGLTEQKHLPTKPNQHHNNLSLFINNQQV